MFGWGKKKDDKDQGAADKAKTGGGLPSPITSSAQQGNSEELDILQALPKPTSVFEFGQPVQLGQDVMRGVCTGDDPDAIQACTWSLEPITSVKGKEKRSVYRIEF